MRNVFGPLRQMEERHFDKLFSVLERIGASEHARKSHNISGVRREVIGSVTFRLIGATSSWYLLGSFSEGTTIPGLNCDVDLLMIREDIQVIENISDAPNGVSLLMIRDQHTKPGYVKLQCVSDGKPLTERNIDANRTHELLDTDGEGRLCANNVDVYVKELEFHMNGPARTLIRDGDRDVDTVEAYRCKTVPSFCQEWQRRERRYGWPSRETLTKIKSYGCFLVLIGHPDSAEKHLEWRISFSLQERELMFQLNPVQHKCYILLKLVKKDLITGVIGKSLSSYHCKTCLFYVIENTDPEKWVPKNLVACLLHCLTVLRDWVRDGFCPNYFIKEENMFARRVKGSVREKLLEIMNSLVSKGHSVIFDIKSDDIVGLLNTTNLSGFSECSVEKEITCSYFSFQLELYNYIYGKKGKCVKDRLLELLNKLSSIRHITEHSEDETEDGKHVIEAFLHSLLAKAIITIFLHKKTQKNTRELQKCLDSFRIGINANTQSTKLVFISVLFRLAQYQSCLSFLEDMASQETRENMSIYIYMDDERRNEENEHIRTSDILNSTDRSHPIGYLPQFPVSDVRAACFHFVSSDWEIMPSALRYELFRVVNKPAGATENTEAYKWTGMDTNFYMYFLLYLVYNKLHEPEYKQFIKKQLEWTLANDAKLGLSETPYNLLGWIYMEEGLKDEALRCFRASLSNEPVHNAARWHLQKLLYGVDLFYGRYRVSEGFLEQ